MTIEPSARGQRSSCDMSLDSVCPGRQYAIMMLRLNMSTAYLYIYILFTMLFIILLFVSYDAIEDSHCFSADPSELFKLLLLLKCDGIE